MNKNNISWSARFVSTQPIILQPFAFAAQYNQDGSGLFGYVLVLGVVISGIFLNYTFVRDVASIIRSSAPMDTLIKEYVWVFVVGCLNIMIFATFYYMFGVSDGENIVTGSWATSFYFSIVTWTTLGYGDFSPIDNLRLVAAFEAMLGYIYMAVLVGLLLNISQHAKESSKK